MCSIGIAKTQVNGNRTVYALRFSHHISNRPHHLCSAREGIFPRCPQLHNKQLTFRCNALVAVVGKAFCPTYSVAHITGCSTCSIVCKSGCSARHICGSPRRDSGYGCPVTAAVPARHQLVLSERVCFPQRRIYLLPGKFCAGLKSFRREKSFFRIRGNRLVPE